MFEYVLELNEANVHSTEAQFVLYMVGIMTKVESYVQYVMEHPHPNTPLDILHEFRTKLSQLLRGDIMNILDEWVEHTKQEQSGGRTSNTDTLCVVHSYMCLIWGNLQPDDDDSDRAARMSAATVGRYLGHMAFVRGRHAFGQTLCNIVLPEDVLGDEKKMQEALVELILDFLSGQGVAVEDISRDYLRRYANGDPIWFEQNGQQIRVPLPGAHKYGEGTAFEPPPTELPEYEVFALQQKNRRTINDWLESQSQETVNATLTEMLRILGYEALAGNWNKKEGYDAGVYTHAAHDITCDMQAAEILVKEAQVSHLDE